MTDPTFFTDSETGMETASNPFDSTLPDEMVINAVHRACEFFGIPEIPVFHAEGTCVWPNDPGTYNDDVFGFNREQLMALGISGEDSLTLIFCHECCHRALQGAYNDAWEEELACDFFAGIHAGLKGIDIDNFEASLGCTQGGGTHPNGALRAEFIEYGKQVAQQLMARGVEPTFDNCLEYLNQHIEDKDGLITEYRHRIDPNASALADNGESLERGDAKGVSMADVEWFEHMARISSCSEQEHWLKEAKWARDHLKG